MKKKIFLSKEDKTIPNEELAKKFNVQTQTIVVAKKRGWFYQGFRDPKFRGKKLPPRKKSKFKKLIHLTDEDRRMSISGISRKFNISQTGAKNARDNGWIAQKLGPSVNAISNGGLPKKVSIEDVLSDVDESVFWVRRRFFFNKQEIDDTKQEMFLRLLEQTADADFTDSKWRQKFAYYAGLKFITRKLFPHKRIFVNLKFEEFEDSLSDNKRFSNEIDNSIDYKDIISRLSPKNGDIIEKWAQKRKTKKIPQKIIKILKSIKNR